ncbi:MAG: glycosyltransferase family 2 protein [Anaerolineae bacterium]
MENSGDLLLAKSAPAGPTASVVIVTYNGMVYLPACLQSVYRELLDADEVIVVDNRSTDGGPQLIRERFPTVRVIENLDNRGFAAACNQGARLATGQVLVFLNQDTEVRPGWLRGLIEGLGAASGAGLTTSKHLLMTQSDRINLCGQDMHFSGLSFARGFMEPAERLSAPAWVGAVSGASFAIRRELWEQLGGFDEGLFMYYEETDLCWRARLAGYRSQYRPDSTLLHDYRPGQHSYARLYYSKRNRHILLLKHWRWPTLVLLLPSLLVAELLDLGQSALIARDGLRAKLKAYGWLASHAAQVLGSRRQVQRMRTAKDWELLASCTATVSLLELSGGKLTHAVLAVINGLFWLNYRLAFALCRALNI